MTMVFKGTESKHHLLAKGIELIQEFAEANHIAHPSIIINTGIGDDYYGFIHLGNVIRINMKTCRSAVRNPGYDWTFPGYVTDFTPYGILAHEFGHYISDILGKDFRKNFINLQRHESNVSLMDDKDVDERMAEAARLFITNPDLLKKGRPMRYGFFADYYSPIIKNRWTTILKNAHPKILQAAENWMHR